MEYHVRVQGALTFDHLMMLAELCSQYQTVTSEGGDVQDIISTSSTNENLENRTAL